MKYYLVTCRHGHHGHRKYEPITFAFGAKDAITAMDLGKKMPGVKHGAPILACREVSYEVYMEHRQTSAYHMMK